MNEIEVKWIKIKADIFNDEKIALIESLPDGDSLIVIWFKMLCFAGKSNNGGVFTLNEKTAYTDEMLATIFRRPLQTVRMALEVFEQFGMVEIVDNVITIPNWEKHQDVSKLKDRNEYMRQYMSNRRREEKMLTVNKVNNVNNVNLQDIDIDKESYPSDKRSKPTRHKYGMYKNVLLSDEELAKLKAEFSDWEARIERLSEYIASSGKSYKSHLATIRAWARKEPKTGTASYSIDEIEKELLGL